MNLLLTTALTVGATAALVALYGRYRVLPALLIGPKTCELEHGGCQALFRTKEAALAGVPNAALGVLLYVALGIGSWFEWAPWLLFAGATPALLMSVWLGAFLVRKKLECRICWTGHAANLVIWLVLAARVLESR